MSICSYLIPSNNSLVYTRLLKAICNCFLAFLPLSRIAPCDKLHYCSIFIEFPRGIKIMNRKIVTISFLLNIAVMVVIIAVTIGSARFILEQGF